MKLLWTVPALDDLKEISSYIEQESSIEAADGVCLNIYESAQMLARHAYLGRIGKLAGTRELVAGKYIIGYRVIEDRVEVLRIWHGARLQSPS